MKYSLSICLLLMYVCTYSQTNNDSVAIVKLLEKAATSFRSGDAKAYADCWHVQPYSVILISSDDGKAMSIPAEALAQSSQYMEFSFEGGSKEKTYTHLCKVLEVIPNKKLSYSWHYKDYEGNSVVTFELFDEGNKTRLKLTHTGLETFPKDNKDFASESFAKGWANITGTSLKNFVEDNS